MRKAIMCLAAVLVTTPPTAKARPDARMNEIPRVSCGSCHIDGNGGGPRNNFGNFAELEYLSTGNWWSPFIASIDSDGDGYTNGQELLDASGTWQEGDAQPIGIATNPGDGNENQDNPPPPTPEPPTSDAFKIDMYSDSPAGGNYSRAAFDFSPTRKLFIASRDGKIYRINPDQSTTVVLDLVGKITPPAFQEEGFCGLAFGLNNDMAYVSYSIPIVGKPNESSILYEEYNYDATTGQMTNPKDILVVSRPPEALYSYYESGQGAGFKAHYSGQPIVVYEDITSGAQTVTRQVLYTTIGDGGLYLGRGYNALSAFPQLSSASEWHGLTPQNPKNLTGKVLRIMLTDHEDMVPYEIPPDNPYFGNALGYREEIVAIGCRNPWGFSYDEVSKNFIVAESGQDVREWSNVFKQGMWQPGEALNFGWPIIEGYGPGNRVNLTPPWNGINPLPGIGSLPTTDTFGRATIAVAPEVLQMVHADYHSTYANTPTYPKGECLIGMIYCRDPSSVLNGAQVAVDFSSRKVYFWRDGMTEGALALNLAAYSNVNAPPVQIFPNPETRTILALLLNGRVVEIKNNLNVAKHWNLYD